MEKCNEFCGNLASFRITLIKIYAKGLPTKEYLSRQTPINKCRNHFLTEFMDIKNSLEKGDRIEVEKIK